MRATALPRHLAGKEHDLRRAGAELLARATARGIETMLAWCIVGLLLAVAIPAYTDAIGKAGSVGLVARFSHLRYELLERAALDGAWPDDALDLPKFEQGPGMSYGFLRPDPMRAVQEAMNPGAGRRGLPLGTHSAPKDSGVAGQTSGPPPAAGAAGRDIEYALVEGALHLRQTLAPGGGPRWAEAGVLSVRPGVEPWSAAGSIAWQCAQHALPSQWEASGFDLTDLPKGHLMHVCR